MPFSFEILLKAPCHGACPCPNSSTAVSPRAASSVLPSSPLCHPPGTHSTSSVTALPIATSFTCHRLGFLTMQCSLFKTLHLVLPRSWMGVWRIHHDCQGTSSVLFFLLQSSSQELSWAILWPYLPSTRSEKAVLVPSNSGHSGT